MGDQLRAPPKPLNTIVLWCVGGFNGSPHLGLHGAVVFIDTIVNSVEDLESGKLVNKFNSNKELRPNFKMSLKWGNF